MSRSNSRTVYEILGRDSVHPFPARMAPDLALDVIEDCKGSLRVLAPMSGSGTVLAIARSKGHCAIGVDIDPLAGALFRGFGQLRLTQRLYKRRQMTFWRMARRIFVSLRTRDAYPMNSDDETKHFVRYWFDATHDDNLFLSLQSYREVQDDTIRDAFVVRVLASHHHKKSGASLAMDLSHSRPHRAFKCAPSKPFRKFLSAVIAWPRTALTAVFVP